MDKYIPYEKLSKKEKRKLDSQKRGTWGGFNPVTRKPENFRAYNRSKARNRMREEQQSIPGIFFVRAMDFSAGTVYNARSKGRNCHACTQLY